MSNEAVSLEAGRFYREHKLFAERLELEQYVIWDCTKRILDLRAGRALTSWGLGGEAAQRQADIIAENSRMYNAPRKDEAEAKLTENQTAAEAHKNEYLEAYIAIARAAMQDSQTSKTPY